MGHFSILLPDVVRTMVADDHLKIFLKLAGFLFGTWQTALRMSASATKKQVNIGRCSLTSDCLEEELKSPVKGLAFL